MSDYKDNDLLVQRDKLRIHAAQLEKQRRVLEQENRFLKNENERLLDNLDNAKNDHLQTAIVVLKLMILFTVISVWMAGVSRLVGWIL